MSFLPVTMADGVPVNRRRTRQRIALDDIGCGLDNILPTFRGSPLSSHPERLVSSVASLDASATARLRFR